jgi:hypothetical protein
MNVIAFEDRWFLIDVGNGLGRVLDLEFGRFFPPQALTSLLAKGSWEVFSGNPEPVVAAIHDVQDLAPEATVGEPGLLAF